MKQENIDKKIGMPDVDAEWAKFEREVINQKTASRKPLYWGIGIAASIALVAGIFLFGHDNEEPQQTVAQQTAPTTQALSAEEKVVEASVDPVTLQEKDEPVRIRTKQRQSTDLLAHAEPPATETAVYDCGEVMPQFPGGERALMEFIKTNMHYPDLAMEYGARGRVIMNFLVDSTGYVSNIKPVRFFRITYDTLYMNRVPAEQQVVLKQQIDSLLGKECIRILSQMPKWTPGSLFGKNVSVKYNVPITFNATEAEREMYLAQKQADNDELQHRIAGLTIVPTSEDLGPNAMRLGGIRVAGRDSVRIGRKTDYDFLVVVNGQPLSEAEQKQMLSDIFVHFYHRHQIIDCIFVYKDEDAKRPYVEKYGERAKNAVMAITTAPDTLCDAYVQQHPELMKTRHRVEGYVIDEETQKPLPDTWINYRVIADTWAVNYKNVGDNWIRYAEGAGAATDSTGHFTLWLPRKDVKLQASRVGYVTVRINQPADTTLTIRMKDATKLREVKVNPKQP